MLNSSSQFKAFVAGVYLMCNVVIIGLTMAISSLIARVWSLGIYRPECDVIEMPVFLRKVCLVCHYIMMF